MDILDFLIHVIVIISEIGMAVGATIPYIPQYFEILSTKDSSGFSIYICLAIITSSVLRIVFWFGEHYDFTLVIQSVLLIIAMFMMIQISTEMKLKRARDRGNPIPESNFLDFDLSQFWKWTNMISFIQASVLFAIIAGTFMYLLSGYREFVVTLGFIALMIEAVLALPQFIKNASNKSTHGMNKIMVSLWFMGDALKLIYFLIRGVPWQFILCSSIQISIDTGIFIQILYYGSDPPSVL